MDSVNAPKAYSRAVRRSYTPTHTHLFNFGVGEKNTCQCKCFSLVEISGLEPPTPTLSGWFSNQLSYISLYSIVFGYRSPPYIACGDGVRACGARLSRGCSNQLSYISLYSIVFGYRPQPYIACRRWRSRLRRSAEQGGALTN